MIAVNLGGLFSVNSRSTTAIEQDQEICWLNTQEEESYYLLSYLKYEHII